MPTPRQIERRHRIIQISQSLFTERGYAQTTLDEVARRAKVGKAIIYRYFGNKEALLLAVFDFVLEHLETTAVDYPPEKPQGDLDQRYVAAFSNYFGRFEEMHGLYNFFGKILCGLPQNEWGETIRKKIFQKFFDSMMIRNAYLSAAIERGELRPHDPEVGNFLLTGAAYAIVVRWYRQGCPPGLADMAHEVTRFVLDGLRRRDDSPPPSKKP